MSGLTRINQLHVTFLGYVNGYPGLVIHPLKASLSPKVPPHSFLNVSFKSANKLLGALIFAKYNNTVIKKF